jgi:AcrR family transcriptional regulator
MTRAEQLALTRQRFLDAAAIVFARRGYTGAKLDEIASLAGYTPAAVYKHFPSKESLFLEFFRGEMSRRHAAFEAVFSNSASDAAIISEFGKAVVALLIDAEKYRLAGMEFMSHLEEHPEVSDDIRAAWMHLDDSPPVMGELCKRLGVEPPMPLDQLTLTMEALAFGLYTVSLHSSDVDAAKVLSDALNLLLSASSPQVPARSRRMARR